MKRMCKKLNSARGASILFAVLVFMLCAFAGAAALTAAAANAGRFSHAERDQQKYLSVASAANLLLAELDTPRLEITQSRTETRSWEYDADNNLQILEPTSVLGGMVTAWYDGETEMTGDFMLRELVETYCEELFAAKVVPVDWHKAGGASGTPDYKAKKLTITGSSDELKSRLGEVYAEVSFNSESYELTIRLWTEDDSAAEDDESAAKRAYETEIRLPARASTSIESSVVETSGDGAKGWTKTRTDVVFSLEWPVDGALIVRN